jgi:hypothetical protein
MNQQFFAQLDENNVVTTVHCVTQEFLETNPDRYQGVWVETFFDTAGKTYAGIGFTYDEVLEDFVAPVVEEPVVEEPAES